MRTPRRFTVLRRPTSVILASLVAITGLLAGCSADSSGESAGGSDAQAGSQAFDKAAGGEVAPAPAEADSGEAGAADSSSAVAPSQQVIVTGEYALVVADPSATASAIVAATTKAGGHIDSRDETGSGEHAQVVLVLRLPADATESTLAEIKKLGTLTSARTGAQDVTTQTIDLDQRISALKASITRLEEMIGKSTSTKDLLEVESMLTDRQAELQSLTSQRAYLADQVSYSTITVTLSPKSAPVAAQSESIGDSFVRGWNAFVSFILGLVRALAVAAPFLVFAGLIAIVIVVAVRRHRRRHPRPERSATVPQASPVPQAGPAPQPMPYAAPATSPGPTVAARQEPVEAGGTDGPDEA